MYNFKLPQKQLNSISMQLIHKIESSTNFFNIFIHSNKNSIQTRTARPPKIV